METAEKLTFTLDEVAAMTGFSEISIQRGCRAGRYKHTYFGKKYSMTRAQVDALLAAHERGGKDEPTPDTSEEDGLEAARRATAARYTRRGAA